MVERIISEYERWKEAPYGKQYSMAWNGDRFNITTSTLDVKPVDANFHDVSTNDISGKDLKEFINKKFEGFREN